MSKLYVPCAGRLMCSLLALALIILPSPAQGFREIIFLIYFPIFSSHIAWNTMPWYMRTSYLPTCGVQLAMCNIHLIAMFWSRCTQLIGTCVF